MVSPIIVAYSLHVPGIMLSPHQITPLGTSDPSEEKATCVSEARVGCRRFHRLLSELARVVGNPPAGAPIFLLRSPTPHDLAHGKPIRDIMVILRSYMATRSAGSCRKGTTT